ncbi:MAG: methylmalonyl-CoA mutase family protein, partial [Armatimonadota bacterium]|nr:methylmalonyl-CoA mutase family protein [Armatimonadota bacterium]
MHRHENEKRFFTDSGIPLRTVYTKNDIADLDPDTDLGLPGAAPYTRGVYPNMYRDRPWRIFQLSGTGTPEDEGARIRYLLSKGETGFIMESDISTWDMLDIDHPDVAVRADEVGMYGAPLMSLQD